MINCKKSIKNQTFVNVFTLRKMFSFALIAALAALASAGLYVPPESQTDEGIVGGVETTIKEHPYQLALLRNNTLGCGASLIKPNVALTAAHCTKRWKETDLSVRAGSTKHRTGGLLAKVQNKSEHPKYQGTVTNNDYDVAVLLLDRSFPLSATIQTISLQPVGVDVPEGTFATVSGWGILKSGAGTLPSILRKVTVPKVSHKKCAAFYLPTKITERMSCYGDEKGGKDACQMDSGGPIVVKGIQTGIVSWGNGCALPKYPGVYTKISNREIADYINKRIADF